jgi:hypothetical protein
MSVNDTINFKSFISRAASMTEKQFKERVKSLGIGVTGTFSNTLNAVGLVKGGSMLVEIQYIYYADFTAWGVGKGVKIGDSTAARLNGAGRKKRNWRKQISASRNLIADQLAYEASNKMEDVVKAAMPSSIIMKF